MDGSESSFSPFESCRVLSRVLDPKSMRQHLAGDPPPRPLCRIEGGDHPFLRRRKPRASIRTLPRRRTQKYPSKVIRKDSAKKTTKKSRVKCFIKEVGTLEALSSKDKKVAALKEAKAKLEERFKTGKNMWFFTKLSYESVAEPPLGQGVT
ncbi:Ribosomal protein L27e protein [Raphanus sativus]|nr:Ribosomal protein L27e protein [Raphanus sativus]